MIKVGSRNLRPLNSTVSSFLTTRSWSRCLRAKSDALSGTSCDFLFWPWFALII